jgi:hypothetical protein
MLRAPGGDAAIEAPERVVGPAAERECGEQHTTARWR